MKTIRYAITHKNRDGNRQLTFRNAGQHHKDTEAEAQKALSDFHENNSEKVLREVYGPQAMGTFRVQPVECYAHGDAVGTIFPPDEPTAPLPSIQYSRGIDLVVYSSLVDQFDRNDWLELAKAALDQALHIDEDPIRKQISDLIDTLK